MVPKPTAGYSGTPLFKKLGIKADHRIALVNAPEKYEELLEPLPAGVEIKRNPPGTTRFDVIQLFAKSEKELAAQFGKWAKRLVSNGGLWASWPKKAAGMATDLTDNVVREIGLKAGLFDVKVCAVDATWSGLKFVIRVKDRK